MSKRPSTPDPPTLTQSQSILSPYQIRKVNIVSPGRETKRTKRSHESSSADNNNKESIIQQILLDDERNDKYMLSEEQLNILRQMEPPSSESQLVRITAGAGSGKTTTLIKLAEVASGLGHEQITYLTYSREAANDVKQRVVNHPGLLIESSLEASTLHSCAMRLMNEFRDLNNMDGTLSVITEDREMTKQLANLCQSEIESFLLNCYHHIDCTHDIMKKEQMKKKVKKKVEFFLFKTLHNFCISKMSLRELGNYSTFNRVYYPAVRYHQGSQARNDGFEGYQYKNKISWYADTIYKLWSNPEFMKIKSFDLEMKRAQLYKLEIPGTCILLDESQDCDACQIDWVAQQLLHQKQVFLAGDAAQTIYGFRGAKSKFLMELGAIDLTLTKSWRFGESITRIANTVLFAKENSPQTTGGTRTWKPYRVTGNDDIEDLVTSKDIVRDWKSGPVTLIAFKNARLFTEAIKLITGFDSDEDASFTIPKDMSSIPKIHVSGRGRSSGANKFTKMEKEVNELYELYMASTEGEYGEDVQPIKLSSTSFPEFETMVTWHSFIKQVHDMELTKYEASIDVIKTFGQNTLNAFSLFKDCVSNPKYTADEADIILSTIHSSKGMEWDKVQLCDDFAFQMTLKKKDLRWQFDTTNWTDDVNMLYVACTRAKRVLSIPNFLATFLNDCDENYNFYSSCIDGVGETSTQSFGVTSLTEYEEEKIFDEIVEPLRREQKVNYFPSKPPPTSSGISGEEDDAHVLIKSVK